MNPSTKPLPPRTPGFCDADGSPLITRADDREEVIRRRIRDYEELTGPILKWYDPKIVRGIDGSLPVNEVRRAIERLALEAVCTFA